MHQIVFLVISACSLLEGRCKDEQIPLKEDVTIIQCTIHGQFEVINWISRNPKWAVRRWTCDDGSKKEANI